MSARPIARGSMTTAALVAAAFVAVLAAGCGEKADGTENAAPPPSANAVAPPVVPNGVQGGPGDLKPGIGGPGSSSSTPR